MVDSSAIFYDIHKLVKWLVLLPRIWDTQGWLRFDHLFSGSYDPTSQVFEPENKSQGSIPRS